MKKQSVIQSMRGFFSSFLSFYRSAEVDMTSVAVAYYLMISIFPILLTVANLLPYLQIDMTEILVLIEDFFPPQLSASVSNMVTTILTKPSNSWLGISIATTVWTISKSMIALQKAVNKAYGVDKHRDFIIARLVGIFLGMGLQLIILFSMMMIAFGDTIVGLIQKQFQLEDTVFSVLFSQTQPILYLSLFLALIMLYFFLPNVRIRKIRYVLPGTAFVLLSLTLLSNLFSLYVNSYASRLLDLRLVTAVVFLVIMLWFIFLSNILIIGAVFNATVQSLHVEEFAARNGDVVSWLNRLKERWSGIEDERK